MMKISEWIWTLELMGDSKITAEFANYINHEYGNVKDEGCIKQYTFREGDEMSDVVTFLKKFYMKDEKDN